MLILLLYETNTIIKKKQTRINEFYYVHLTLLNQ